MSVNDNQEEPLTSKSAEALPLLEKGETGFDHSRYAIFIVIINLGLNFAYVPVLCPRPVALTSHSQLVRLPERHVHLL